MAAPIDLHEVAETEHEAGAATRGASRPATPPPASLLARRSTIEASKQAIERTTFASTQWSSPRAAWACAAGPARPGPPARWRRDDVPSRHRAVAIDIVKSHIRNHTAGRDQRARHSRSRSSQHRAGGARQRWRHQPGSDRGYVAHGGYRALEKVLTELRRRGCVQKCSVRSPRDAAVPATPRATSGICSPAHSRRARSTCRQRRRGRPRRLHGPHGHGRRPAPTDRGHRHRRVRHRRIQGLHLRAGRVPAERSNGSTVPSGSPAATASSAARSSKRLQPRGARSESVPARSSAARRPRCMHRSRAKRGTPQLRPPYPTERGLWGHPTMINNVETLANIAPS